jgi:tRNA G18 (ribose-2'-O)-methylase SpoU
VYLERLRSAHNVGSILRTVEGLGLGTVYFAEGTPFIDHHQVKSCSMESYNWVNCFKIHSLSELPRPLILLETGDDATGVHEFQFPDTFTLAVGNEETGCSDSLLAAADCIVQIPMRGRKNSLNVANAFALTAGEIVRQYDNQRRK